MKPTIVWLSFITALALTHGLARAEQADRDQPMNVAADALRYDDQKQTSVFSGHVVLTKGSILIRGAKVELRQDGDGYQFGTVSGEPGALAFFRQKREGLDEFIEGESQTIDYDGRADSIKFTGQAQLRRYRGASVSDELSGAVIIYNNRSSRFSVDGAASAVPGAAGGRVRAMLSPKPAAASPPASSVVPPLRSSGSLGEAIK